MIEAELDDGTVLEFPDGTDTSVIQSVVRKHLGVSPKSSVEQIPSGGDGTVETSPDKQVKPMSMWESALQGAAAVPILAAGARGLQLLTRGSKAAPYVGELAKAVIPQSGKLLAAEGVTGAAAGVGGQLAAERSPKGWEPVGGMLGGAAAGMAASVPARAVAGAKELSGLFSQAKDITQRVGELAGSGRASKQAITALTANPRLADEIIRASDIEALTGINFPMAAAANGDTTISSYLQSQMSKGGNAPFTAAVKQQYEQAEREIGKAKGVFAPPMEKVDALVKQRAQTALKQSEATTARREQGLEQIDERIQELSGGLNVSLKPEEIGTRLSNLVESRASVIRSKFSPEYEKLIQDSMDAGIKLPADSAKTLRAYAIDEKNADVFADHPALLAQIKRVFKPEGKPSDKFASKYPALVRAKDEKFTDYSLEDIDSLKRAVNKAIRDSKDPDKTRRLVQLKSEVDGAIDTIDPKFSDAYRSLDEQYAKQLGIPFSKQGVVQIDRARFVENTVPTLTSKSSSLKDALGVIGNSKEGMKIVEDAFMFDVSKQAGMFDANGVLNPAKLSRYIKTHQEQLNLVPGLESKLRSTAGRVDELMAHRGNILALEKQAKQDMANDLYVRSYGESGGLANIVRKALTNQQDLDNLLQATAKDKTAREGVKAAMLDDLVSMPNAMESFATNRASIEKVFGKTHSQYIEAIVEASQRLRDYPFQPKINIGTIPKTKMEEVLGSKPETTLGELRNQVMTGPRVLINHLSRFFQNTANQRESAEVQKFLLDPKALKLAAEMYKEIEVRGFSDRAKDIGKRLLSTNAGYALMSGMVGLGVGAQIEGQDKPIDPSLLEGFGVEQ